MSLFEYLVFGAILGLAIWKLYELFFGTIVSRRLKQRERELVLLGTFFAEFTYKTMNNLETYQTAPKEIYKWLDVNFGEWSDSRVKTGNIEAK